jgi:hypothetical protein
MQWRPIAQFRPEHARLSDNYLLWCPDLPLAGQPIIGFYDPVAMSWRASGRINRPSHFCLIEPPKQDGRGLG